MTNFSCQPLIEMMDLCLVNAPGEHLNSRHIQFRQTARRVANYRPTGNAGAARSLMY